MSVQVAIRLAIRRPSCLESPKAPDFRFGLQDGMAKFMRNTTTQKQLSSHPEWLNDWQKRIKALKNLPSLLGMVWAAAPIVVVSSLVCRLLAALVPLVLGTGRVRAQNLREQKARGVINNDLS